jgi:hypothetical protein
MTGIKELLILVLIILAIVAVWVWLTGPVTLGR